MWKKCLAFASVLALIILLDPSHTPAQPGGGKKGKGGGGGGGFQPGGFPQPGGTYTQPGGGPGAYGGGAPGGGMTPGGPPGMGGPGGGPGGRGPGGGGGGRPADPERTWTMLLRLTQSTDDTVDLSKIPPQSRPWISNEKAGALPLPESGVWTKDMFLDFHTKSEAAKAAFAGAGAGGAMVMAVGPDGTMTMNGRGQRGMGGPGMGGPGMGGPGGWGPNGWDPNAGWGQQGWDQQGGGGRPPFEKKETEEERPVAMRYGKLPKDLPAWFNDLDIDKDGQVSLYEWRKAGNKTAEFIEMDLNGDGLITADEYLRFARQKNINTKVAAYEESDGAERPANWGIGAPLDAGDKAGGRPGRGTRPPGGGAAADGGPADGGGNAPPAKGGNPGGKAAGPWGGDTGGKADRPTGKGPRQKN